MCQGDRPKSGSNGRDIEGYTLVGIPTYHKDHHQEASDPGILTQVVSLPVFAGYQVPNYPGYGTWIPRLR